MATNPATREAAKKNNSLRDFQGVNTQAARQVIGDNQFAWLENVQPVGFGNMPAIPAASSVLATWTGTAYHMKSVNILGTDYELVLTTDGALYSVNLTTNVSTLVGASGTFNGSETEICQWENAQAIIVDPTKGYFSWDGTTLTRWNGTVQSLTITAIGTGYTSSPTLGFSGGGGSGAAATAHIQVGLATLTAGGLTYNVGDTVTIAGGTAVRAASLVVSSVSAGVITGANIVDPGEYTAAPANPAATTSPYGTGATFTLNFGIGPIVSVTPGSGYTSAPAVGVTLGGGTGGTVTANLAVVPAGGTAVATYAGRVWVASNRTVAFSAPSSFSDFSSTAAGGSFIVVDETLHSTITQIIAANNFLYIMGSSSVNVVADVTVTSGVTTFSNTNISASIGTSQPYSVVPYYRALWFAAPYGIYALYGSTTQKASDDLDGVFPLITNAIKVTSGTAVLNNVLALCFMFKYADPVVGARTLVACFANKKWFFASQGDSMVSMDTAVINGSPTLYATDGTSLYRLFSDTTRNVAQTMITKLWDMGDPLSAKQAMKLGVEVTNPVSFQNITGTIDTEASAGSVSFTLDNAGALKWVNNSGVIVSWVNSSGAIVQWATSGYLFLPTDVQTAGRYIGITLNGTSASTIYSGMHLQFEHRAQWPQIGAQ